MNNEKAALKHLLDYQVSPEPDNWSNIVEELDRTEIGNLIRSSSENPSSNWSTIESKLDKKNEIQWRWIPIVILGVLLANAYLRDVSSNEVSKRQLTTLPIGNTLRNKPTTFTIPDGAVKINANYNQSKISPEIKTTRSGKAPQQADINNYLLVAAEDGKPIRVPIKWSALSCCLSGENDSVECKEQQNGWHRELATAGLGFQADPILGLMELIDATDDR